MKIRHRGARAFARASTILTALLIAKGLGGKIAVLDTERGSASKYARVVEFDARTVKLPPGFVHRGHQGR